MKHRLTWRGFCPVHVEADSRAEAIQKAIEARPMTLPRGAELHYGLASGRTKDAVFVVDACNCDACQHGDGH
jgi:hypothetical protein